ncbi:MAG: hypothetical protein A3B31_00730 [Candidatus Komeilibacteria bacterium RIFCSPLOWO2_01_FULL_53_11]|uniref:Short-chain dehydrogenase n=1 Tax=Candidatus Komeilibacteria bacterium RIFCSPLOWO2_01_FULL_53_11 TaxID=1798552 RepID=A0A1G2BSM8_9BACT|nr:MAG: hypothetical protein A3B31_00730 [Candidatus Komeilibacteria bacterium RIFCSPLOWO2_01_FULL_53_11]
MKKIAVLITGCGYKPVRHVYRYKGEPTHSSIFINGVEYKMNIGTAAAYFIAKHGTEVIMVSKTAEKLKNIKVALVKLGCKKLLIKYITADITNDKDIVSMIKKLPANRTIYWVQSLGMGGGSYKIPHDNIYLPFEKISPELINEEANIVVATHRLMLQIVPRLRRQVRTGVPAKISIVTSMSGERGYHFGATHVAAKHGLVGYIKGIEKELEDAGIEIRDIRPGAIDTGMYDSEQTKKAVETISELTKMWGGRKPIYASPIKVAEKIYDSLFSKGSKKVYRILSPHQR